MSQKNDKKSNSNEIINRGLKYSNPKKFNSKMKDVSVTISRDSTPIKINEQEGNNMNSPCTSVQNFNRERQKNCAERKSLDLAKETNLKYGSSYYNKSIYNKAPKHPFSRRKSLPVSNNLTNTSAKVVLFERNVEIKDLESKVKYLQNKIKQLEGENKTLQNVQSRQEKELRKFKEGVADIPSLLKSHREEIKAYETTISSIRKELSDSHKEIKSKNEILLKKDNQIDKLSNSLKKCEKAVHDSSCEIKELRSSKRILEEEIKILSDRNEDLKKENDSLCKKVQNLLCSVKQLEDNFNNEMELRKQLEEDFNELKEKCEAEKVSTEQQITESETIIISDLAADVSDSIVYKSSVGFELKDEDKCLEFIPFDDQDEKSISCDKSVEKTKSDLANTFICYQTLCNMGEINSNIRMPTINNFKILPPLKTPKNVSRITLSESDGKEGNALPAADNVKNINQNKFEELKDFSVKVLSKDSELDCSENTYLSRYPATEELSEPLKGNTNAQISDEYFKNINNDVKTNFNKSEEYNKEVKKSRHQKKTEKLSSLDDKFKDFLFSDEGIMKKTHFEVKSDPCGAEKYYMMKTATLRYSDKKKRDKFEASLKGISKSQRNEHIFQNFQ